MEAFWRSFLARRARTDRRRARRLGRPPGLKNAIGQVLGCPWQRCSVHFLREALGHARREQQPMLAALLWPIVNLDSAEQAHELLGEALQRLGKPLPKIAALLEQAEEDLLAFYALPPDHWSKLRSTNPLERFNREIGRRTDVVGIFPNDRALIRLAASVVIDCPAQQARRQARHRRLRQWPLIARIPPTAPDRRAQDRQVIRSKDDRRQRRCRPRSFRNRSPATTSASKSSPRGSRPKRRSVLSRH
jgi:hypothetical protein